MAYLKAAVAMTLGLYTSGSFVSCNLFQMGRFVVARFLMTSAFRGPSAIAELLVLLESGQTHSTVTDATEVGL